MMRLSRLADFAVVLMTHVAENRHNIHTAAKVFCGDTAAGTNGREGSGAALP